MLRHPISLALSTYKFILREVGPGTKIHHLKNKSPWYDSSGFLGCSEMKEEVNDKQVRLLSLDFG
jgi:hypothetical protein